MENIEISNNNPESQDSPPLREYSSAQALINNFPYIVMIVLGTIIFEVGFGDSAWRLISAGAYLVYGVAGSLWIIIFVCPYCRYWNTRSCPCGYGRIAVKLRKKRAVDCFNEKFKRHIPVIVPLWFIPILISVPLIICSFSWMFLLLLVLFVLDAFIVLPLVSTKHGCKECPQNDSCPWMKYKIKLSG